MGELVRPGAVRTPDVAALGARDRTVQSPERYLDDPTFHPTFLYESLWNLLVVALLLVAERRWRLRKGSLFALYVAAYTVGRFWIEALRVDDTHHILGLRLNDWTSLLVFLAAAGVLWARRPSTAPGAYGEERADEVNDPSGV